jgi:LysM repeat protein
MADLEQLKQKYASVIELFSHFAPQGAVLEDTSLDGEKLVLKGSVPSTVVADRVWDTIKEVDPTYADLQHEIATTGTPEQSYMVAEGDNLSRISQFFYGKASHYQAIAEANNMDNPDKVQVGQELKIPVLS